MLQFCLEHNLRRTFDVLTSESGVALGAVPSRETLVEDVLNGRWDGVLNALRGTPLAPELESALYDQLCVELVEQREFGTASALLARAAPLAALPENRLDDLRKLCANKHALFDVTLAYGTSSNVDDLVQPSASQVRNVRCAGG